MGKAMKEGHRRAATDWECPFKVDFGYLAILLFSYKIYIT